MGLFNVFIVVPQLLVATVMGSIMKAFFPDQPIWTMLAAAMVMAIAALAMLRVKPDEGTAIHCVAHRRFPTDEGCGPSSLA